MEHSQLRHDQGRPSHAQRLEIRCNVGDAIVANLAVHIVFFYERHLDTPALVRAFVHALTKLPIYAGRMALVDGTMRIRCAGQSVPFASVSSDRTLGEAIRSTSEDGRNRPHARRIGRPGALVCERRCVRACFRSAHKADPAVTHRTLAIAVNARNRCGLDPMLVGNIITTLNVDVRRDEAARSIAERIRHSVDHFADEHCEMRINQQFLDGAGAWRAARCVSAAFNPVRWNRLSRSGAASAPLYRVQFEDTFPVYCTPLLKLPVAGPGALVEAADGRGLVFQMSLPPREFEAASSSAIREHVHRFRCACDDIPRQHQEVHS